MQGRITYWNNFKGYGFVQSDNADDYFIHMSGLLDGRQSLERGDVVTFELASDVRTKKTIAAQVRVIGH